VTRSAPTVAIASAMIALYLIWGSTYLAIHVAIRDGDGFPPLYMAALRQLTAGSVLYAIMRLRGAPRPTLAEWRGGLVVGALLIAGGNGGISLGERSVDSSIAAIVVASMPLWIAVIGLRYGAKPTRREGIGLLVGFTGVIVLNAGASISGDPIAFAAVIASPILWAWGSILSTRVTLPRGPMASAVEMLCGGVILVVLGALFGEHFTAMPTIEPFLALGYLIVLGSLVAFSAYGFLLRTVRPAVAASYAYVNPIVAIVLGVMFDHEGISGRAIVATALTLGGVFIIASRRQK
jgi:drug/metabolite transporter (DMT)-like permease